MCPPGLHISLGIFLRLFVLLENDCHLLDMTMRTQGVTVTESGPSYEKYAQALDQQTHLKDEQLSLNNDLRVLEQQVTVVLTSAGISPTSPLFLGVAAEIQRIKARLQQIVRLNRHPRRQTILTHANRDCTAGKSSLPQGRGAVYKSSRQSSGLFPST